MPYPDELMMLKGNGQFIFVENLDPIAGQKLVWYADPAFSGLGVNLQKAEQVLLDRQESASTLLKAKSGALV